MSKNKKFKECNIPYVLAPKFNKECNELLFYFPSSLIPDMTFEN